jgi:DNA helicase-2/ATP-dependent DNA helicase PcrA
VHRESDEPGPAAADRVVAHRGGPLLVLGAAGTGKSSALVARLAALVREGAAPESVLVLTPTAPSADALRERVEDALRGTYEQLSVHTVEGFCARLLHDEAVEAELDPAAWEGGAASPADRLATLLDRVDELTLRRHDLGGNPAVLLAAVVARIDRCKAEHVTAADHAAWAAALPDDDDAQRTLAAREREFAALYADHDRMLAEQGAIDGGDLLLRTVALLRDRPHVRARVADRYRHVLVDGLHDLDFAAALLVALLGAGADAAGHGDLVATADPDQAIHRQRAAAAKNVEDFRCAHPEAPIVVLERSHRCPQPVLHAARAIVAPIAGREEVAAHGGEGGQVALWRCAGERAQAQAVAAEAERLIRAGTAPRDVAVVVRSVRAEGRPVAVALEERGVPYRIVGAAAFFQRAEVRDVLAWLRLLTDPTDAGAVVRALARPPVELRSVDLARTIQIARRRKLDMVSALVAATESPQVAPEARERILGFLRLHRAAAAALDTTRPDLFVHRLVDRLGLRRQGLFAAQADVVARLRNLARVAELAGAYVRRSPQATSREFARYLAAVAEAGLGVQEAAADSDADAVQVCALRSAAQLDVQHAFVLGLHAGRLPGARGQVAEPVPDALLREELPPDDRAAHVAQMRRLVHVAMTRTRHGLVLAYPAASESGAAQPPSPFFEEVRAALGAEVQEREEELFGPEETLHATFRALRDELLEDVARVGKGLMDLRLDTELDVTHAVVRHLELVKLAALLERPPGHAVAEALPAVNGRLAAALSPQQRDVYDSSPLDALLLDAEREDRGRAAARAARSEPSLEAFLPRRGDGLALSASDIESYRTCPLKYKFARVFRIPQEPTVNQRFGIVVHQVLERYHQSGGGTVDDLLLLLDTGWRRSGLGDGEQERQLRTKADAALRLYHGRVAREPVRPVWFERPFSFRLGAHTLRGRVDRVDELPGGGHELIDYKTGRPRSAAALREDVQLSLYAVGAREAWALDAAEQAYLYVLDDEKVRVPREQIDPAWIAETVDTVAGGILAQDFEPTPSHAACSMCDFRIACPAAER